MSKADGIYMSTDFRITRYPTGELVDDATIKFLTIQYPPDTSGPKALIAYSGAAFFRDGTPTGTWIRETLRGESDVIDNSMKLLRERLDRDYGPLGLPLSIRVMVIEGELGERRLIGRLSNTPQEPGSFVYEMSEAPDPVAFADGSGGARVWSSADLQLLRKQLSVWPNRPEDHMGLLAAVNRRVASKEPTVSPYCHVSHLPTGDQTGGGSRYYTEPGEADLPFEMPSLLFGIDLTDMMREFQQQFEAHRKGLDPPEPRTHDEINKGLRRRP